MAGFCLCSPHGFFIIFFSCSSSSHLPPFFGLFPGALVLGCTYAIDIDIDIGLSRLERWSQRTLSGRLCVLIFFFSVPLPDILIGSGHCPLLHVDDIHSLKVVMI